MRNEFPNKEDIALFVETVKDYSEKTNLCIEAVSFRVVHIVDNTFIKTDISVEVR